MISQAGNRIRHIGIVVAAVVSVSACSSNQPVEPTSRQAKKVVVPEKRRITVGERAAAIAMRQIGVPYRYGGTTPRGFDCSGLVHYSYANVGKAIPRTTKALWSALPPVDDRQIRVGDLLFFSIAGKMSHVGLYLGNRRFVHAPSSGRSVSVESLDSEFYRKAFIRAGRP